MKELSEINDSNVLNETSISSIKLSFGNLLFLNRGKSEIRIINSCNKTQLSIKITQDGLIVDLDATKLTIHADDELRLISQKIIIDAAEQINLTTGGNIIQQAGKDCLTEVAGTNKNVAQIQKITANLGNVEIKANDDVRLDGERVKLNCI